MKFRFFPRFPSVDFADFASGLALIFSFLALVMHLLFLVGLYFGWIEGFYVRIL